MTRRTETVEVFDVTINLLGAESERFVHRLAVPIEPAGAILYAKSAARREIETRLRPGETIARLARIEDQVR